MGGVHGGETTGQLLTAAEAGERLGYSERYVRRLGREGVLPRVKVPGRKYVPFCEADVERFEAQSRHQVVPRSRPMPRAPAAPWLPGRF